MQVAGSPKQTGEAVRPGAPGTPPGVPSWGRVLATTISLWTSRRLPGLRRPMAFLVIGALVLAAAVVGVVKFTGTPGRAARAATPGRPHPGRPAGPGPAGAVTSSAWAQAAAWVASQLGDSEIVGCDPLMCAALGAHGVAASRLLPLRPAAPGSPGAQGADVIVASAPAQGAPVLLASFGSGASLIQVRAATPGGAAAYQQALRADLAARRSAGAQLLHSRRLEAGAQSAAPLRAGEVDSRLLIMLAMLASQHQWRVVAFAGASPGVSPAVAPFRQVIIAGADSGAVAAALALARAQRAPYQPAQATAIRLAGGQAGLLIDFAAPSPLGLLTGGAPG